MTNKVLVYVDHFKGEALPASWEAIGAARKIAESLGSGVTAVIVGQDVQPLAKQAIEYGADDAVVAENPALTDFRPETYADVLSKAAAEADVLLLPTSGRTRELAAMVAVDL